MELTQIYGIKYNNVKMEKPFKNKTIFHIYLKNKKYISSENCAKIESNEFCIYVLLKLQNNLCSTIKFHFKVVLKYFFEQNLYFYLFFFFYVHLKK